MHGTDWEGTWHMSSIRLVMVKPLMLTCRMNCLTYEYSKLPRKQCWQKFDRGERNWDNKQFILKKSCSTWNQAKPEFPKTIQEGQDNFSTPVYCSGRGATVCSISAVWPSLANLQGSSILFSGQTMQNEVGLQYISLRCPAQAGSCSHRSPLITTFLPKMIALE